VKIRDRIKSLRRVAAKDLIPNPKNWRTHPSEQSDAMRGVLAEIGFADAVLARETKDGLQLIDGHLRAEIAPDSKIPVLILDVTDEEADKILATHDPLAAMAGTNDDMLQSLVADLDFDSEATQAMLDELCPSDPAELDDVPPQDPSEDLRDKWKTERGQLWLIEGKQTHRLLCGDSTNADDVGRLMAGELAGLVATDPPYGVEAANRRTRRDAGDTNRFRDWGGIENDKRQGGELSAWLVTMWETWLRNSDPQAAFYLWTAAMEEGAAAAAAMRSAGIHIQSQIVWVKNQLTLGQTDYQWKHENCWFGFLKGKQHIWNGGRKQTTVWEVKKVAHGAYLHPMQKPAELYAIPIRNHTSEGDVVAEPFSGSGTQLLAADQLNRRCYAMEIEPKYIAVCLQRLTDAGCKCTLENTNGKTT